MTYTIEQTPIFRRWLGSMRDLRAKIAVARRIDRVTSGNLGNVKHIADGVLEMRLDIGPGYRVYFTVKAGVVIILLAGGDKSSQAADIRQARQLAREV